uniref:DNA-directed DNA polymerase family A palm domain-containing protein n=1 Tax=Glaukea argentea TaxID=2894057 RepID=A0A386B1L8_9CHLO|nr:hypothetical protein [Udotea argentea]AYC65590.1 hypothetical protein [Udotea argentea]
MLHVFNNGLDLHTFLASKIFNQSYEELMELKKSNPKEFKRIRSSMKPVNFGKTYGMGAQTLWQRFLSLGQNRTFKEVEALHRGWDVTFPQIRLYQKRCTNLYSQSKAQNSGDLTI